MKRGNFNFLIILILLFNTSCYNTKDVKVDAVDNKKKFTENVQKVLEIVKNNNNGKKMNFYSINDKSVYGIQYNENSNSFDYILNENIEDFNFVDGKIAQLDNKYYLTIESKDYCAVKKFDTDEIVIYNVNEKSNCHIPYTVNGGTVDVFIKARTIDDSSDYNSGDIAKTYIYIECYSNIIDNKSYSYQWYRNDEKIDNSNINLYTVAKDYEDANYYVEITTNTGEVYKSETVNVKIDKES